MSELKPTPSTPTLLATTMSAFLVFSLILALGIRSVFSAQKITTFLLPLILPTSAAISTVFLNVRVIVSDLILSAGVSHII
jgi:hypothetical protein